MNYPNRNNKHYLGLNDLIETGRILSCADMKILKKLQKKLNNFKRKFRLADEENESEDGEEGNRDQSGCGEVSGLNFSVVIFSLINFKGK